jgi:hypothetical protein
MKNASISNVTPDSGHGGNSGTGNGPGTYAGYHRHESRYGIWLMVTGAVLILAWLAAGSLPFPGTGSSSLGFTHQECNGALGQFVQMFSQRTATGCAYVNRVYTGLRITGLLGFAACAAGVALYLRRFRKWPQK